MDKMIFYNGYLITMNAKREIYGNGSICIENDRIIIKTSNEYYITIHLDYYRFVLCYYNLFIDAVEEHAV